jgi:hypothetical protein
MKTKHTPGPWITDTSHKHEWEGVTVWADSEVIAHVVPDQHDEHEANAKLIEAAPDLLEACKLALEELEDVMNWAPTEDMEHTEAIVENAIRKATK